MNFKQTAFYPYLIVVLVLFVSPTLPLYADISTDGTVGAAQTLTGPDYTISETLGTIKGDNLFHSFDKFSIKTQESATFTGSNSIKNVISRVTGGEKSEIDGILRSNVGSANFYFINPSGVVFGENAKVDVPAAFHVSTTDELKFKDGASFKASKSEQSTLTQAAPESFGFLDTQSTSIEVNGAVFENRGSIEINASNLEFKPESKVSLISSKDITIKGTEKETTTESEAKQASLTSAGGEIELKAGGDLLMENAGIDTSGNGGGKISLKAGNLKLNNSSYIFAYNTGDKNSEGGVDVKVDKQIDLTNGSAIASSTWSKGDAGSVIINAENMKIDGQGSKYVTGIASTAEETNSEGKAGTVEITVSQYLELINGGQISSSTWSKGDAGNVKINAGNMKIDDQGSKNVTGVASDAEINSEGKAGTVVITVDEYLELINGGSIGSATFSKGDAGSVKVNAKNMKIDGQGSANFTLISSSAYLNSEGNAGTVEITVAECLELLNGGQILSSTFSKGDALNVKINTKNMKIDGQGSSKFTGVASSAYRNSEGNSGTIAITVAEYLELINGASIISATFSKGDAGSVKINAENMKIDGQEEKYAGVFSSALAGSEGNSGTVEITVVELLDLINGGAIRSSTFSKGDAGDVIINADKLFSDSSHIDSAADYRASGYVGIVKINADSVNLINGSAISIAAYQTLSPEKLANMPSDKSIIILKTKQLTIEGESQITSASTNNVPASDIKINSDVIYLKDGLITTSVSGTNGDGGNISINEHAESNLAGFLVMQNGFIQANTLAEGAKGGSIRINQDTLLIADKSMPFQIGGEPEEFSLDDKKNIIQAADPSKNPQDIETPTVPVDLGSSLINSGSTIFEPVKMAENYCRLIGTKRASSIIFEPREWFVPAASANSSIYFDGYRLDELLKMK